MFSAWSWWHSQGDPQTAQRLPRMTLPPSLSVLGMHGGVVATLIDIDVHIHWGAGALLAAPPPRPPIPTFFKKGGSTGELYLPTYFYLFIHIQTPSPPRAPMSWDAVFPFFLWSLVNLEQPLSGWGSLHGSCEVEVGKWRRQGDPRPGCRATHHAVFA